MPCRPRRSPASSGRGARSAARRRSGTGSAPRRRDRSRRRSGLPICAAALLGEQRVRRGGARELAVLEREAEQRPGPGRAGAVRVEDPHAAARGPAPERHRSRLERLDRAGEVGGLAAGERRRARRARSSSSAAATPARSSSAENGTPPPGRLAYERRLLAVRRLGKLAGAAGERAQPLSRRLGLAQAREVAGRVLPVGDGLAHRGRVARAGFAPRPCRRRRGRARGRGAGGRAASRPRLVGGRRGRARSAPRRPASARAPATTRARPGSRCSRRTGSEQAARPGRDGGGRRRSRPARGRSASRRAISTPIASASPRGPADSSSTRPSSGATRGGSGSNSIRSRWRSVGLLGVALVEGELARDLGAELAQLPDQLCPRRQRPAIGEGDRDGDVPGSGERVDQLELGAGEVVEPVDEHRPGAPRVGVVAQGADRRGERRRPVAASARLAQLDVAANRNGRARARIRRRRARRRSPRTRAGRPAPPRARRSAGRAPGRTRAGPPSAAGVRGRRSRSPRAPGPGAARR